MAAILGLDADKVEEICSEIKSGFVKPANYNCIGQIVISGEKEAVNIAIEKAKEAGAKRAIELKTSGPFHTSMLENASKELKKELNKIEFNKYNSKVIKNIDGKEYKEEDDLKNILALHIINPVRFDEGLKSMLDMGIDTFVEIGPGKTLSGFVKRTSKDVTILNINDCASLENAINVLKQI
jgi:[acyl-carrier-protein] S-malonyltransferase